MFYCNTLEKKSRVRVIGTDTYLLFIYYNYYFYY